MSMFFFVLNDFHSVGLFTQFYCDTSKHYIFNSVFKHIKRRAVKPLKQENLSTYMQIFQQPGKYLFYESLLKLILSLLDESIYCV